MRNTIKPLCRASADLFTDGAHGPRVAMSALYYDPLFANTFQREKKKEKKKAKDEMAGKVGHFKLGAGHMRGVTSRGERESIEFVCGVGSRLAPKAQIPPPRAPLTSLILSSVASIIK